MSRVYAAPAAGTTTASSERASNKSLGKRVLEAIGIRKKLDELGLDVADPGIAQVREVLNDFVRGHGFTGAIPVPSVGRVALMKLSLQAHVKSVAVLRTSSKV